MSDFNNGDRVRFKPGRSPAYVEANVIGKDGVFLVTKDDAGKERKVRAGAAKAVKSA